MSANIYVLPNEGGVGVGKQLQMLILEATPSTGLEPLNQGGVLLQHYTVAWKSSDALIASVDQHGQVNGLIDGEVTITATVVWAPHGPKNILRSKITVGSPVATLRFPKNLSLPAYCTRSINVQPLDSQGRPLNDRPVTWQSNTPHVVSIQSLSPTTHPQLMPATNVVPEPLAIADGIFFHRTASVSGKHVGQALITATCESVSINITVLVVSGNPTSLKIFPDALVLDVQEFGQAMVMARNQERCLVPNVSVTWGTTDSTVAIVDQHTGKVQGLKAGTTKLTATIQSGLADSIDITIPSVSIISFDPCQISELDIGAHSEITATLQSSSGTVLANRIITWSASNNNVSLQPSSGYKTTATGGTPGQTTVKASSEGAFGTMAITVPSVRSISIEPPAVNVSEGSSVGFKATPRSSSGTVLANRMITWSASNNHVSLQPSSGYKTTATGGISGDATVKALSEGISATAAIHVQTYCESNVCAFKYRVENYSNVIVDIYQLECDASGCSQWTGMATVNPGYAWTSLELVENNIYQVRAVEAGHDVLIYNYIKMDSSPFFGGHGIVAVFTVY
jgi:uncharacterized protein YjdB